MGTHFSQILLTLDITFRAFSRHFDQSNTNSHIDTLTMRLPCKVPNSTSGAVSGSVSCPRTLQHADQGNQTSDLLPTIYFPKGPNLSTLSCLVSELCHTNKLDLPDLAYWISQEQNVSIIFI